MIVVDVSPDTFLAPSLVFLGFYKLLYCCFIKSGPEGHEKASLFIIAEIISALLIAFTIQADYMMFSKNDKWCLMACLMETTPRFFWGRTVIIILYALGFPLFFLITAYNQHKVDNIKRECYRALQFVINLMSSPSQMSGVFFILYFGMISLEARWWTNFPQSGEHPPC